MTLDEIRNLVKSDLDKVNQFIIERTQAQLNILGEYGQYMTETQGKRLRPMLLMLVARACGYEGQDHIKLAAVVEYFHTATLLHDDVVDHSEYRRGKKTANLMWGSEVSVLLGDYLYSESINVLLEQNRFDLIRLVSNAIHTISSGEIKQMNQRNTITPNLTTYFEVIEAKTAVLFATAAALGAMLVLQDENQINHLYKYGLHLGNAYQLIDDVLDYSSDFETMGKNMGDDLAEGKATLPLIHALNHSDAPTQALIKESLKRGTLDYLNEILQAINDTQAIAYTKEIAHIEKELALEAIKDLPSSEYKNALISFLDFVIDRNH